MTDAQGTSTNRIGDEQLDEIVRRLGTALSPQGIYVFGSHAYGKAGPDSDIDLLIVVDDASQLTIDFLKRAHACLDGTFQPFELHFRSSQNFEQRSRIRSSLEHEVSTKGRLLHAA